MDAYFDSAIIVKLYVREATSPAAIRLVGTYVAPYWLTQWQALDVNRVPGKFHQIHLKSRAARLE
jgi:hypothetical protein